MAKQTLNNLETFGTIRTKSNDNFTELYNAVPMGTYFTGRSYLFGPRNNEALTSTNTNLLTTNTIYAVSGLITEKITISTLGVRTGVSNASNGASVILGIYNCNTDGTPGALLGSTGDISISGTSTVYSRALTSSVTVPPGVYFFALIPTATVTAAILSPYSSNTPWLSFTGASSIANAGASTPIVGYTGSGTYASGLPSTFPTPTAAITAVAGTATNQAPVFLFTVG